MKFNYNISGLGSPGSQWAMCEERIGCSKPGTGKGKRRRKLRDYVVWRRGFVMGVGTVNSPWDYGGWVEGLWEQDKTCPTY